MSATDIYKKRATLLVVLLVAILPLGGTIALRNALLIGALLMLGAHLVKSGQRLRDLSLPLWSPWLLYAAVACLGQLWAIDPAYSFEELRKEIPYGLLFFFLGLNLLDDEAAWRVLRNGVLASYVLQTLYCLGVWLTGGTTKDGLIGTWNTGVGGFSTYLVAIFPLLVLFALEGARTATRQLLLVAAVFSMHLLALFITDNRQSLVATVLELGVLSVVLYRVFGARRMVLCVVVVVGVVGTIFSHKMIQRAALPPGVQSLNVEVALEHDQRLPIWRFVWSEALSDPWKGAGFGRDALIHRYPDNLAGIRAEPFAHAHNMIVNRLVQLGFPGAAAFLLLFWSVAWKIFRQRGADERGRRLAVAGIALCLGVFVKNMTDDFFFREYGYLFWILAGAFLGRQASEARLA